jgi:CMP-N-acetylneuraminic acid synthetase
MFSDSWIVIPARAGSKGLPFKNRTLFHKTADIIPAEWHHRVVVTTDDPVIKTLAEEYGFKVIERPFQLGLDRTSTKEVLVHLRREIPEAKYCVTLYLTYPERTWSDVENVMKFMVDNEGESLLCKKELTQAHPYLFLYEDGIKGRQIVHHNLYRRQDYPKVFELSHFIQICEWKALPNLNDNLYGINTIFYPINSVVDVDTPTDLEKFLEKTDGKIHT